MNSVDNKFEEYIGFILDCTIFASICAMRLIIRYISPVIRSRRRFSFLFTVGVLFSVVFILFITNHRRPRETLDIKPIESIRLDNGRSIVYSSAITTIPTTTRAQK